MPEKKKKDTKPIKKPEGNAQKATSPFSDKQPSPMIPWVLDIYVGDDLLQVQVREQMIIGRGLGAGAPDVDLSAYRAEQNGVSRRHAILLTRSRFLTIRDLNSTNGTFLNGLQLPPDQDVPLEHGDVVVFGSLETRLMFAVLPPHKRATADSDYKTLKPEFPGSGQHVLVIEDDHDVAQAYQLMLRTTGFRVSIATKADEAAAVFSKGLPDAVVLDLHLRRNHDNLEGMEVLHLLNDRMMQAGVRIPVVIVTGMVDEYYRDQALAAGATLFLPKPIRVDELAIRVGTLIHQMGSARA